MTPRIERADAFCVFAHGSISQRRRFTGEPYHEHPRAVARRVAAVGLDEDAIEVALLHDVVEDTPFSLGIIRAVFGSQTADRVDALTDPPTMPGLNRATRKAISMRKLGGSDRLVQSVKVADLTENTLSIVAHDPSFARVYLKEKKALLEVLTQADATLMLIAREVMADAWQRLRDLDVSLSMSN